jgi:outer membrane protein TolC
MPRVKESLLALLALLPACSPTDYRNDADRETYQIIAEKAQDPRWQLREPSIYPPAGSRLHDPWDPDQPPMPPDDPSAQAYSLSSWQTESRAESVEDPSWRESLDFKDSRLVLTPDRAVELGLLHSREYQAAVEELYLSGLALTMERYEFDVRWFGNSAAQLVHAGSEVTDGDGNDNGGASNAVVVDNAAGFRRAFSTGGQLLVELANTFVWEFAGNDMRSTSSNVAIDLIQPLLRGAGQDVRLEDLTQAERNVLYAARRFARFRKEFYFEIVAGEEGFLALFLQRQSIRNLRSNVASLERNLAEHEALAEAGLVSRIQVDQVFQSFQTGKLALIQADNEYKAALDEYKIKLGLPPSIELEFDDSMLGQLELADSALAALKEELPRFLGIYRELEATPSLKTLRGAYARLASFHLRLLESFGSTKTELARLKSREPGAGEKEDQEAEARRRATTDQLSERLQEMRSEVTRLSADIRKAAAALREDRRSTNWETLLKLAGGEQILLDDLFLIQTQVRAHLIELKPVDSNLDEAWKYALANRLDLMNRKAQVVDAWRRVHVAANGLQSDLNLLLGANFGTVPDPHNPFKFSRATTSYRVGFRFDAPLDRLAERNLYRVRQLEYEAARRDYMALEDGISRDLRDDVRQLEADRINFDIARQSLIVAARQVEETRDQLMAPAAVVGDSSSTQDLLSALDSFLDAQNGLIGIWVAYERVRLQLLLDIDRLQLDENGHPSEVVDVVADQANHETTATE